MIFFLFWVSLATFSAGFLIGWWLGFNAPIDDRAAVDELARRDRHK